MRVSKRATLKQKIFSAEYLKNGGNAARAALKVYNAKKYKTAQIIGSQNLDKPAVRDEIAKGLEKAGISLKSVYSYTKEALEESIGKDPKNSDAVRLLDMLFRLLNAYPEKRSMQLSYSVKREERASDPSKMHNQLKQLNDKTNKLLTDLSSS